MLTRKKNEIVCKEIDEFETIKQGATAGIEHTVEGEDVLEQKDLKRGYEELLREFGPGLARLASSYEAIPQAREDLLQEILMALWIALPKYRGDASLRTFVYRIAHNRALTHVWQRKGRGTSEPLEQVEIADGKPCPEAVFLARDRRERMLLAIRKLPEPMRQIITLALEDLSHAEIAAVLGISENNVAVRLSRVRAALREAMGGK